MLPLVTTSSLKDRLGSVYSQQNRGFKYPSSVGMCNSGSMEGSSVGTIAIDGLVNMLR